uniref:Transferase, transferring glycosyl groups / transferase, transferring hexosyl groups n=1 Tax=Arundo donax TaxID=35708 RepID=A0A0A8XPT8_ARUDO
MPEQIHKVHRRSHEEQMLRAQQRRKHDSPSKITPLLEKV